MLASSAPSAPGGTGGGSAGPASSAAATANSAAATKKAVVGPCSVSSTPASAGPTKTPSDSMALDSTLAAVRSAGELTSSGMTADCAARKTMVSSATAVTAAAAAATEACTAAAAPLPRRSRPPRRS